MKNKLLLILAMVIAMAVSACTGNSEPTEKEMAAAVTKLLNTSINKLNDFTKELTGSDTIDAIEIKKLKKLSCQKATEKPGYVCDVDMTYDRPVFGSTSNQITLRFVKTDDGWVAFE